MSKLWLAYLQLAGAMCMVGANIALSKTILETVPVLWLAALRFIIASLVLFPLAAWRKELRLDLSRRELGLLFLIAFFGVFLFNLLMLYGLKYTTATSAGIITSTIPAATALLSVLVLGEKLPKIRLVAVALAVLGVALINLQSSEGEGIGQLGGNALVLGAVFSEALFVVIASQLAARLPPILMSASVNFIALVLFLPLVALTKFDFSQLDAHLMALITIYALTASVFSFWLWYSGSAVVPASRLGLFTGFMPVSATVVGLLFLGEVFSVFYAVGMICVLGGIFLGTYESKYR